MKRLFTGLLLLLAPLLGLRANPSNDSIYTQDNVIRLHMAYPDSALRILDVMEQKKLQPACLVNTQRGLVYNAQRHPDIALSYLLKAYKDPALKAYPEYQLQAISCISDIYKLRQDYVHSVQFLDEGIRIAREAGQQEIETMLLFDLGSSYYALYQYDEAYKHFKQAIENAENDEGYKLKPSLSYFYGQLTSILEKEGKTEEALAMCRKREGVIREMETYKNIPIGYLDQQRGYLYSKEATLLATLGDKAGAAQAYQRFLATHFSKTREGLDYEALYNLRTGQYDKVINFYLPQCGQDTFNTAHANKLEMLVEAYQGKQDYRQAFLYQQRLTTVKDSLSADILRSQLAEQSTLSQIHEKEWTIKEQEHKLRLAAFMRTLLLCVLAVAILFLVIVMRNARIVKLKNRKITSRLNEQIAYEEQIEQLKHRLAEKTDAPHIPDNGERQLVGQPGQSVSEQAATVSEETKGDAADKEIFEQMEALIKEQKLYKNPELSRQDMLSQLAISKNRFAQMMQDNTQMSFTQYLTNLRLHYALALLNKHENYTIQAISDEAGFASLRNFRRAFKAKYGITPSEYRENRQETAPGETDDDE